MADPVSPSAGASQEEEAMRLERVLDYIATIRPGWHDSRHTSAPIGDLRLMRREILRLRAETPGLVAGMRETAAKVCESRAKSLAEGGQYGASNEAGKCARAIRAAGAPSVVSQEFWDSVHRQRELEADAEKWRSLLSSQSGSGSAALTDIDGSILAEAATFLELCEPFMRPSSVASISEMVVAIRRARAANEDAERWRAFVVEACDPARRLQIGGRIGPFDAHDLANWIDAIRSYANTVALEDGR